jgi:opacity protein-like surface antigen
MMKKVLFVLVVAVALAFPTAAFCQAGWGAYGGLLMPQGDLDDAVDMGFALGAQWFTPYSGNDAMSWGVMGGFGMASGDRSIWGYDIETDVRFIEIIPTGRYNFAPGENMSFFGQVGLGLNYVTVDADYYGYSNSESDTEFGFTLGGGVQYSQYEGLIQYKSFNDCQYITLTVGYNF